MARFLRIYLIITGLLTALVLVMPWLVLLGFLALIVPGMLLAAVPSAFVYGLVFASGWVPSRRKLGDLGAIPVGVALIAAVALGLPALRKAKAAYDIAELREQDILPAGRLALAGILRVERPASATPRLDRRKGEPPSLACDDFCAAALFTPGITGVVLAATGSAPGRSTARDTTYRLVPRPAGAATCPDSTLPVEGWNNGTLDTWPDLQALRPAWMLALAEGRCLLRDPPGAAAPASDWTLRFESVTESVSNRQACRGPQIGFRRVQLTESERVVLRQTSVTALELVSPFSILPSGGLDDFRFDCHGRRRTDGAYGVADLLSQKTNLGLALGTASVKAPTTLDLRASIEAALANPKVPADAPVFALIEPLFAAMAPPIGKQADIRPGDAALIGRLIADQRVHEVFGLFRLLKPLGPEAALLRSPVVTRLLNLRFPEDRETARTLGRVIGGLPEGIFTEPTADERRLLADDQRRRWATGLVFRQADRGASAAPDLVQIIAEAHRRPQFTESRRDLDRLDDADAAVQALCRLGPDASGVLPSLDALIASGTIPRRALGRGGWDLMLARLGKPVEQILKPEALSGTQAAFQDRLRRRLTRFRAEDCRQV